MNTSTNNTKIAAATASVLGTIAYNNGVKCAPCLDSQLVEMLNNDHKNNLAIMKAWTNAWHNANLADVSQLYKTQGCDCNALIN